MVKKSVSILTVGAIAVGFTGISATASLSQMTSEGQASANQLRSQAAQSQPKVTFVCATNNEPPTTYAIAQNGNEKPTLTPVLRWHSEYLVSGESAENLCQKMAQKFQDKHDRGEAPFIAYKLEQQENTNNRFWNVCFVSAEGQKCDASGSEILFSVNNSFKQTPKCVINNVDPSSCERGTAVVTRGPLLSIPASRPWWTAIFSR
jgi:hypothetical protein